MKGHKKSVLTCALNRRRNKSDGTQNFVTLFWKITVPNSKFQNVLNSEQPSIEQILKKVGSNIFLYLFVDGRVVSDDWN